MRQELALENIKWVKIIEPTENEITALNSEFSLHPLVLKELLMPTIRPKVDTYDTYFYMILHVPVFDEKTRKTTAKEIDFILLRNTIITITYETVKPLEEFWALVNKNAVSRRTDKSEKEISHLLYHLIHHLFAFSLRELDHVQENINTLEDIMFYGSHEDIAHDIYMARRDIIDFRRALYPQEEILHSLEDKGVLLYGEETRPFLRNLTGQYYHMRDILDGHKEAIQELYETNESIINNRLNRTMKFFTVLAFITFIPSLVANIFGMNVDIPLAENGNAFWLIIVGSLFITLIIFTYFKLRKML